MGKELTREELLELRAYMDSLSDAELADFWHDVDGGYFEGSTARLLTNMLFSIAIDGEIYEPPEDPEAD